MFRTLSTSVPSLARASSTLLTAGKYRLLGRHTILGQRGELTDLVSDLLSSSTPLTTPSALAAIRAAVLAAPDTIPLGELGLLEEGEEDVDVVAHKADHQLRAKERAKREAAVWGTVKSRVVSLVEGMDRGYVKRMEMVGVGYRAWMDHDHVEKERAEEKAARRGVGGKKGGDAVEKEGKFDTTLVLKVGFSHDVPIPVPASLKVKVVNDTIIVIQGVDKQEVGEFAARVRRVRKPDAYKGKGVRYEGEVMVLKQGKRN